MQTIQRTSCILACWWIMMMFATAYLNEVYLWGCLGTLLIDFRKLKHLVSMKVYSSESIILYKYSLKISFISMLPFTNGTISNISNILFHRLRWIKYTVQLTINPIAHFCRIWSSKTTYASSTERDNVPIELLFLAVLIKRNSLFFSL